MPSRALALDGGNPSDDGRGADTGGKADAGRTADAGGNADASIGVDAGSNESDAGPPGEATRVFVTSSKYDGNFGGLVGADAACQELADAAALGGTWLTWMGDGTDGPSSRFVQSSAEYRLMGGGIIAENWADLIDGTIGVPIDHDETGTVLPAEDDTIVWTGVFHTGGDPTPVNCSDWTVADDSIVPTGLANRTDTGWTVTGPHSCSEFHRLYCFEQ